MCSLWTRNSQWQVQYVCTQAHARLTNYAYEHRLSKGLILREVDRMEKCMKKSKVNEKEHLAFMSLRCFPP